MTAALLAATSLIFGMFFFINLNSTSYILPLINIIISISAALALYALIVKKSFKFSAYFSTTLLFAFLTVFTYFAKNESFALVWTFCYPLFVVPILGARKGMIMVALFYSVILPMAYMGISDWDYGFWDIKGFTRFTLASVCVVYTTYFFEVSSKAAYQTIQETREKEEIHLMKLESLSVTDQLTGLYNRRYFDNNFEIERQKIKRYNTKLCLIMVDIDHFKQVNDEYGHQVGDIVLKDFAALVQSNIRETDLLCRWGGEEFIILLPETTLDNAINIAKKILTAITEHSFSNIGHLTASFGVARVDSETNSNRDALYQADQALYQAKNQGRNQVVAYQRKE